MRLFLFILKCSGYIENSSAKETFGFLLKCISFPYIQQAVPTTHNNIIVSTAPNLVLYFYLSFIKNLGSDPNISKYSNF